MEALREGAPEAVNSVPVEAEQTEESSVSVAMKNNSSRCQDDSEGRSIDTDFSYKTENVPVNYQDHKGMETVSSTTSEAPYDSAFSEPEKAMKSEQESTNLSVETSVEIREIKASDTEDDDVSSLKPADNPIPTTSSHLVTGDGLPKMQKDDTEPSDSEALLLSLPADSLHAMASFLTPNEFCNFALCSQSSARICREIFRRVRLHGFRCATEVVTAWSMNEQADAKELCALYISSGVPIYPHSLGHSYHTLVWRMGIEAQEMRASSQSEDPSTSNTHQNSHADDGDEVTNTSRRPVDRFFVERYETRAREGLNYEISYLEEKSLYMLNAEKNASDANSFAQSLSRQISTGPNRLVLRPPPAQGHVLMEDAARAEGQGRPMFRLMSTGNTSPNNSELLRRRATKSNSPSDARDRGPRVVVKVHRHLLDQHLLGRSCVDDKDGMMTTSPVNLSADFFHPLFRLRAPASSQGSMLQKCATKFTSSDGFLSGEHLSDLHSQVVGPLPPMAMVSLRHELGELLVDPVAGIMQTRLRAVDATFEYDSDEAQERHSGMNVPESIFEPTADAVIESPANRRILSSSQHAIPTHPNIFVNVDLDVYSTSSANRKSDFEQQGYRGSRSHLRARFAAYHLRLETLLAQHDSYGFDECMLDFWDEFLPQTANIHYYDRHTAVPRISSLQAFLTKPCPKAIGVVQCEIERIKIGSKKKGVNMKGRFFPTYEYRLFIRHRPVEAMDGVDPVRRDTVLMTAKNRGRKYFESSMPSGSSKKGANNYYLYVPQQEDIEQHYKSVNGPDANTRSITNGASNFMTPCSSNSLMGRLQSNFIGTEFQIFTQKSEKKDQFTKSPCSPLNQLINPTCASEEDYGYDSGVSSDNPSSSTRRRSRFGRLSLRRHAGAIPSEPTPLVEDHARAKPLRRSRSSGDVNENARRTRTSRRAIANDSEGLDIQRQNLRQIEEEDGAITYTANLLGSRPRIMDVCIPKVTPDGVAGVEWRKYLEKCITDTDGGSGNRMLHHLKLIQQRMESEEHGLIRPTQENENRDTGDYSPPDDFGLLALQNRPPWWNIELGSFVLNFGGRVSVASVKNFQLCHRTDQDYIMLQFGRIQGRHSFTMDFQHPLTAVQAFAIAISSLQSKISFG